MSRTPIPTPRRSHRERRPPEHLTDNDIELPTRRANDHDDRESCNSTSIISAASGRSHTSVRAAELRLRKLREEQELQRKVEEASRALALHQATSELEIATLEEEERSGAAYQPSSTHLETSRNVPVHLSVETPPVGPRRSDDYLRPLNTDTENPGVKQMEAVTQDYRRQHPEAGQTRQETGSTLSAPVSVVINQAPKMDVIPFDGKPEKYPFFKMQVEEVRKSGDFTDAQIIQHLRDRLKGDAFEAVHGMLLSGGSLQSILRVLETNFGSPFVITQTTTEKLLNRPKVRSADLHDLSHFCTEVYNAMSVLEAIGYQSELDNYRTISTLAGKLPSESRLGWGKYARTKVDAGIPLSCRMFHEYLSGHVQDFQFSVPHNGVTSSTEYRSHGTTEPHECEDENQSQNYRYPETLNAVKCYFCSGRHWIAACSEFQQMSVSERRAWVRSTGACQRCLSTYHSQAACRRQRPCGRNGCAEEHHVLLHDGSPRPATSGVMSASSEPHSVLMKTLVVELAGPKGKKRCVAYLDEGSSLTLISRGLVEELGLEERHRDLNMRTLSGVTKHSSSLVEVDVSNVRTGETYRLRDVFTMSSLSLGKEPVTVTKLRAKYPELIEIPSADSTPRILIGIDNAELIATQQFRRTNKNGPFLQQTRLGWTLTGRMVGNPNPGMNRPVHRPTVEDDDQMDVLMGSSWQTESFGCKCQQDKLMSTEYRQPQAGADLGFFRGRGGWSRGAAFLE